MMGVSLFGTCTMKYNPRLNERSTARPWLAELHPRQDERDAPGRARDRRTGSSWIAVRAVGDGAVRLPARAAAPTPPTRTPASPAPTTPQRGELGQRDEVITTIQAHPCNCRHRGRGRVQGDHAAARGGRLPVAGGAGGCGVASARLR